VEHRDLRHDAFWERGGGSQQRGVPFVLVHKLFASVPKALPLWPEDCVFELNMEYDNGDGPQRVELTLGDFQNMDVNFEQTHPSAPDFPLLMPGFACAVERVATACHCRALA
jgi:hypothetical protein